MKNTIEDFKSPIGELEWVIITGEGKEGMNEGDPNKYVANVVLSDKDAKIITKQVDDFWAANRPKSVKTPGATGLYPHSVPTDEIDEDTGKKVYAETGKTYIRMSSVTKWPDGNDKVIKVYNAKGAEVDLGTTKIGNGSVGRLIGKMAIYAVEHPKTKVITSAGVTFYLSSVQVGKLVEYKEETPPDEMEGDFEGVGEVGAIGSEPPEKPEL